MPRKLDIQKIDREHQTLLNERNDYEDDWRSINDYILPGRGIFQTYTKPRRRKVSAHKAINTVATEALEVLVAGMQAGLVSQSRRWFALEWDSEAANEPFLQDWLAEAEQTTYNTYAGCNFYAEMNTYFQEMAGFGNGVLFQMEDDETQVRFELATVGEYTFSMNGKMRVDKIYRTLFMTARMIKDRFGEDSLPEQIKILVKAKNGEEHYFPVVHAICPEPYMNKPYTSVYYLPYGPNSSSGNTTIFPHVLRKRGFYEMPATAARWSRIGSDAYGHGPGHRSLQNTKRLQEMEKSFLMAVHLGIQPPVNVPSRMRDQVDLLPSGKNYYNNPNELIKEVFQGRVDLNGIIAGIDRVEEQIRRQYYNDVFLTASRDPNASPLRTGEVEARQEEKYIRLGPVIQQLQTETFEPIVERTFNILLRAGKFPEIPPQYLPLVNGFKIRLVSPLAQAQKSIEARSIESFLSFVGGVAQFDQQALDNVDTDRAVREYHDITGSPAAILRDPAAVQQRRQQRAEALAREKAKEEQMAAGTVGSEMDLKEAQAAKAQAEAGATFNEARGILVE